MRWNLLNSFDKIYVLDLHGNSKRKEASPDGSSDKNVFDIQQGVSINIFIKSSNRKNKPLADVYKADLWGERISKYNFLNESGLKSVKFKKLIPVEPFYFFVDRDYAEKDIYEKGIAINELFTVNVTGVLTARDSLVIDFDLKSLKGRINHFCNQEYSDEKIRNDFFGNRNDDKYLQGDTRGWKLGEARKLILNNDHEKIIRSYSYRPFDSRQIYYSPVMVDWSREKHMKHLLVGSNLALDVCKQLISENYTHAFIINDIADDSFVSNKSRERGYVMPLYLYPDNSDQQTINNKSDRTPNLNKLIIENIASCLSIKFINEKEANDNTFAPIDVLDYIYAVLYSPTYRSKYKEFLKIDFPRVPYPKNADTFWKLVKLGGELRRIHLLESPVVNNFITKYPINGSNEVTKLKYEDGKVWINVDQYFDHVPQVAWEFYIGGYQPTQKWLKDRKGRVLSYEDIQHYQKIIVALVETDRIMKEIDMIEF
jgi:predicted helicase